MSEIHSIKVPTRRIRDASGRRKDSPEYSSWRSMRKRCYDKNHSYYEYWGGRGIIVCDRWKNSFELFFADMGSRPSLGHTLGRINQDGNYEPGNVVWATATEQANNRRARVCQRRPKAIRAEPVRECLHDLAGVVFGRWTVLEYVGSNNGNGAVWQCRCECGAKKNVIAASLKNGRSKSCGCLHKEKVAEMGKARIHRGHHLSRTPEYAAWNQAIQRCVNPKIRNYDRYGGRGIKVCERWLNSFEDFLADMGARPSSAHSLDRFPKPKGDYEPGNCRWATLHEQARNKERVKKFMYLGESLSMPEISKACGVKYSTLRRRLIERGLTIEEATRISQGD